MPWYESQGETYQRKILESQKAQERHLETIARNAEDAQYSRYVASGSYPASRPEVAARVGLRLVILVAAAVAFGWILKTQMAKINAQFGSAPWNLDKNHAWTMCVVYLFIPGVTILIALPMVIHGIVKNTRLGRWRG